MKNENVLNDTVDWLKLFTGNQNLSSGELHPLFSFLLLWSLFESMNFDSQGKGRLTVENLVSWCQGKASVAEELPIDKLFSFFRKRYFPAKKEQNKFSTLNLSDTINNRSSYFSTMCEKNFVENALTSDETTIRDKLTVNFLIIYRFRNNAFHGRKRIVTLNRYTTPFIRIIEFMKCHAEMAV